MMAIAHQIAGILGAKHKQRIQIGIVERVLGALQPFPQHPLRIESRFPIDRNESNVRHDFLHPMYRAAYKPAYGICRVSH